MATSASPGPGSGTRIVSNETAAPSAFATTPRTSCVIPSPLLGSGYFPPANSGWIVGPGAPDPSNIRRCRLQVQVSGGDDGVDHGLLFGLRDRVKERQPHEPFAGPLGDRQPPRLARPLP